MGYKVVVTEWNWNGLTPHLLFAILGDHKLKFLSAVELNLNHYCCCCSTIFDYLKGFAIDVFNVPVKYIRDRAGSQRRW